MIDMNKKYRYRDGGPARILCTDRKIPDYPVVSMGEDGGVRFHKADGRIVNEPHDLDLFEVSAYDHFREGDIVRILTPAREVLYREWAGTDATGNIYCYDGFHIRYTVYGKFLTITLVCRKENIGESS